MVFLWFPIIVWGPRDSLRFLQIGQWRLGALNDDTFVVEHSTGHTVQTYYSDPVKSWGF